MPRSLCRRRPSSTSIALAVAVLALASAAGAQSLPAGWSISDIGGAPAPGSASQSAGTFSISSRGFDVSGTSDQFTFLSTRASGDVSLVARVASLQNTDPWSLAGLMIRQSLSAGSTHASIFVTPANGLVMRGRAVAGAGTVQATVGSAAAPVWLRLERRSTLLKTYKSTDGVTWTLMASIGIPLSDSVVVGVALASHSTAASVAASVTGVSLNGLPVTSATTSTGNLLPSVSLNSPSGGSAFAAPATIALGANAVDRDGTVARVDFYAGGVRIGSDATSPYTFSWGGVPVGSYVLKAVAVDNAGATAESSPVTVTVSANKPPLVSLVSPLTGMTFAAPATIPLTAIASDLDGSIQKVDFYNGSTLIGSDSTSPYTFNWLNVAAGSYSVSAIARDNLGATTVSSWSEVRVGSTSTLSKATFAPAVVSGGVQFYLLEVFAAGADPRVAAPIASQNLGLPPAINGVCTADVKTTIASLAPGSYLATVSSLSTPEGKLRSAPFAFTR